MSIYKPPKSRFFHYDFRWKGNRFHGSTGLTSKRDAERFEAAERRRVALGENKPVITVDEGAGLWWDSVGKDQRNAGTVDYQLKELIRTLGRNTLMSDVGLRDFDRHVKRRKPGRAAATINREIELARRVWRWIAKRDYAAATIEWGALLSKEPAERVRELTEAEERRLFDALPESLRPVVEFALLSGQRKSEVIKLRWSDVDLAGGRATFPVKGGDPHTIPLTPAMVALIANQPRVAAQIFTYVCERPSPPRGDRPRRLKGERYPFSKDGWARHWKRALAAAGVTDFRFHDLRHTKGTRALRATGNLKAVQRLLGHTQITTTARYAHAMEDDVRKAMLDSESRTIPEQGNVTPLKGRAK